MRMVSRLLLPVVFAGVLAIGLPVVPARAQMAEPKENEPKVVEQKEVEPTGAQPKAAELKASDLRVVQPKTYESGSVIVTANTAEVREGPSHRSEVITVVERGEIFEKVGRTKGWYYVKLGEEAHGWISGRAVRRYRGSEGPIPYTGRSVERDVEAVEPQVEPYPDRYYPYYPEPYYGYPYFWDQPYLSWDWYIYDYDTHRHYDYYRNDHRDHYRSYNNGHRTYNNNPRVEHRSRTGYRGYAPLPPRPVPPRGMVAPNHRPAPPGSYRRR